MGQTTITKAEYIKWLNLIVRGIYLAEATNIELTAGTTMEVLLKCTFDLPKEPEPVIKYVSLQDFDGVNFTCKVSTREATAIEWHNAIKNREDKDGGKEGTGSTAGAPDETHGDSDREDKECGLVAEEPQEEEQ